MRRSARWLVTVMVAGLMAVPAAVHAGPPATLEDVPESFVGPEFGAGPPSSPTRYEHQGKLWYHDDAWWGLMLDPSGVDVRIFELRPDHTWLPTETLINVDPVDTGDALSVGDTLYVVSRRTDAAVQFVRLGYDRAARRYVATTDPPVVVTDRGTAAPASIARDTVGRLWVTFATTSDVFLIGSGDDGATWGAPLSLSAPYGPLSVREAAAIVSFDGSVGVMWSDQARGVFRFAVHRDGAPDGEWRVETALEGPGMVDDHISLKVLDREPADAVVAAVKTSQGDHGEPPESPLILVLSRAPDGTWSSTLGGTVADSSNSPVVQLDATNQMVYLLAHRAGSVYVKKAPLDKIEFPPGHGDPFVTGDDDATLTDPAGSTQPVDAGTGLVVLASGTVDRRYHHAELKIPGDPPPDAEPDDEPPNPPSDLVAAADAGTVSLYWSASGDGERWAPTAEQAPVRGYAVLRDGVEIATTSQTSFADAPEPERDYEYGVQAIDFADNRSSLSTVGVLVRAEGVSPVQLAAWSLLGTGAITVALLLVRRWFLRRS